MFPNKKQPIYGNQKVLSPDGCLMFRCQIKKCNWYLDRDLANRIDETTIQLNFQPKGLGMTGEPFYLEEKDNRCVVCGAADDLTRHHCVPYQYRRRMPWYFKKASSHDVLPCCMVCHQQYEEMAIAFKDKVGLKYGGVPFRYKRKMDHVKMIAHKRAYTLLNWGQHYDEDRTAEMMQEVAEYLGRHPTTEDLHSLSNHRRHSFFVDDVGDLHSAKVIEQLKTDQQLIGFIVMWRKHFIESMKPQFLPPGWSLDYVPKKAREVIKQNNN